MKAVVALVLVVLGCGCRTGKVESEGVVFRGTGVVKRALCVGMLNSRVAGECPGADVDAKVAVLVANEYGFETQLLENEGATRGAVLGALRGMVRGAEAGSLLWLFWSGHGGQVEDLGMDEVDGLDECLFPWDDLLLDDELADVFDEVKPGVRVFCVFDTCHSGTMARRALISPKVVRARSFRASLLVFAGCAEDKVSFGSSNGGVFWTGLFDALRPGISWEEWFDGGCRAMVKRPGQVQVPQMTGYGDTSWVNQPALK